MSRSSRRRYRLCFIVNFLCSVSASVASPERPSRSRSWILKTFLKSQASVEFCTPKRRSLATATHPSPHMAMIAAPL